MKAVFLSDVHLRSRRDTGYDDLLGFLRLIRGRGDRGETEQPGEGADAPSPLLAVDHLFIAGDFFDFWFCQDDHVYPEFSDVVERLVEIKSAGVQVSLCEGNHDFYLEDFFSQSLGMDVFTEWAVLDLDGRRTLLSHGDTIDRKNRKYLALRALLRSRMCYRLQRRLPLSFLWRLAQISSRMSKELTIASQDALVEKMRLYSREKFQDGFDAVILGHCHKPLLQEYTLGGRKRVFATLGDWSAHRAYLSYEDGRFTLAQYRP